MPHAESVGTRKLVLCLGVSLALAEGAWAGTSTLQHPTAIFLTPGPKTVTLTACDADGCTSKTRTVNVLDPTPSISSATANPGTVEIGRWVALRGSATGQLPLVPTWILTGPAGFSASLPGFSPDWDTSGLPAGNYLATLAVAGVGLAQLSVPVTLIAPRPLAFYTVTPCRALDTRGGSSPTAVNSARRTLELAGVCGIPAGARAVVANLTVVNGAGLGRLLAFAAREPIPSTWTVSYAAGQVRAVFALVTLSQDGRAAIDLVAHGAPTDVIVDVSGYYVP